MPKFDFGAIEWEKTLKAFGWSVGSAVIALLISVLAQVQFPIEFAFLGPIINTVLVAIYQFAKDNS